MLAKLKAGKPVTIVTMGDSLTDTHHWANREVNWPALLKQRLEEKYKTQVTIVNPAIGGTQLRQNLVLIPTWLAKAPEPDLVTICFGGNDWDAGMRGKQFRETCADAVDRVRRATKGKADVLIVTTVPSAALGRGGRAGGGLPAGGARPQRRPGRRGQGVHGRGRGREREGETLRQGFDAPGAGGA